MVTLCQVAVHLLQLLKETLRSCGFRFCRAKEFKLSESLSQKSLNYLHLHIEENGKSLVGEGIIEEYIGIVNYAIMGIIQLKKEKDEEYSKEYVIEMHNHVYQEIKNLMIT